MSFRERADRAIVPILDLVPPMLDDRDATPSTHELTEERVWNRSSNQRAWKAYLGELAGGASASCRPVATELHVTPGALHASETAGLCAAEPQP